MAGMDSGGAPRGHDKKKKKHKRMRRLGIRIDMTPMVDVAFLLLTFFMLTTSMNRPQTMEINWPPPVKIEVQETNVLTLLVKEDGSIYWNIAHDPPQKVEYKDFRTMMRQRTQQNPKLVTLLKIDRKGKYHTMVDIMDEMNEANVSRFSLAPLDDKDKQALAKVSL